MLQQQRPLRAARRAQHEQHRVTARLRARKEMRKQVGRQAVVRAPARAEVDGTHRTEGREQQPRVHLVAGQRGGVGTGVDGVEVGRLQVEEGRRREVVQHATGEEAMPRSDAPARRLIHHVEEQSSHRFVHVERVHALGQTYRVLCGGKATKKLAQRAREEGGRIRQLFE